MNPTLISVLAAILGFVAIAGVGFAFTGQDPSTVKAAKRADGKFQTEVVSKVFTDYADPHAKDCALK